MGEAPHKPTDSIPKSGRGVAVYLYNGINCEEPNNTVNKHMYISKNVKDFKKIIISFYVRDLACSIIQCSQDSSVKQLIRVGTSFLFSNTVHNKIIF